MKFVFLLLMFYVTPARTSQELKLFNEDCHSETRVPMTNESIGKCDPDKHLECIDRSCVCQENYMHDGACGCKWGLIGIGAKCSRSSGNELKTCDFTRNLTCDTIVFRCRCILNHFYNGNGTCLPGNGTYGDPCHLPVYNRTKPRSDRIDTSDPHKHPGVHDIIYTLPPDLMHKPLDSSTVSPDSVPGARRRRDKNLDIQKVYEVLMNDLLLKETNSSSELGNNSIRGFWKIGPGNKRNLILITTNRPEKWHTNVTNQIAPNVRSTTEPEIKCDPTQYNLQTSEEETLNETELVIFIRQESTGQRCNPSLNLQCFQGKCACINENNYGMYRRDKAHPGTCKRADFYSCSTNDDCVSRNCLPEPGYNQDSIAKLCQRTGLQRFPPESNVAVKMAVVKFIQVIAAAFLCIVK